MGDNTLTVQVTAEDGTKKTYTVSVTREAAPPLTATFENVPAGHTGAAFTFDLVLSDTPSAGNPPVPASFKVAPGTASVSGSGTRYTVMVIPKPANAWKDVTVTLLKPADCTVAGAICTADGRALSNGVSRTITGPVRIRLAGAKVKEAPGATLDFAVTLGFALALKADAFWVRTESAAARAPGVGNLAAARADATRVRAVLDGSRTFALAGGRTVAPSLALGLRHDGGDAGTGAGLELGAGVGFTDPSRGLDMALRVYGLAAHAEESHREWGVSGSLKVVPGGSGRGLSMALTPSYGADRGDAQRLWTMPDTAGLAANDEAATPSSRLDTELGYADPSRGLDMALKVHGLAVHAEDGYDEWGVSGSLRLAPGAAGRGLSASLTPSYGVDPAGSERLWAEPATSGLASNGEPTLSSRLDAELGYGLPVFGGGFTGTPNVGFGLSDAGRDLRLGWRLTSGASPGLELNLDAVRRDPANGDGAEHGVMLRGTTRW